MDKKEIINKFNREMNEYHIIRKEKGYTATKIEDCLKEKGGYETAKIFIGRDTIGFKNLSEKDLLEYSIEALVIKPEYSELFDETQITKCKKRLEQHGYTP